MSVFTLPSKRGSLSSVGLLCLTASLLLPSKAHAQFVTNSPDPFQGSILTLQSPGVQAFLPLGYAKIYTITDIMETNNMISGSDDVIDYSGVFNGTFYTTPALTTVSRQVTLTGDFEVTLFNRTSPFQTGNFNYQVDSVGFSSNINGHTLMFQLNPDLVSEGMTTIDPGPGLGQFTTTAPALVYGEYIVDGGNPVKGPGVTLTVGNPPSAVPEPGLDQMVALFGIAGLLTWRRTKRR